MNCRGGTLGGIGGGVSAADSFLGGSIGGFTFSSSLVFTCSTEPFESADWLFLPFIEQSRGVPGRGEDASDEKPESLEILDELPMLLPDEPDKDEEVEETEDRLETPLTEPDLIVCGRCLEDEGTEKLAEGDRIVGSSETLSSNSDSISPLPLSIAARPNCVCKNHGKDTH